MHWNGTKLKGKKHTNYFLIKSRAVTLNLGLIFKLIFYCLLYNRKLLDDEAKNITIHLFLLKWDHSFLTSVHWTEAAIDVNQLTQFLLLSLLASWALDSDVIKG